jgi:hypothetical protein
MSDLEGMDLIPYLNVDINGDGIPDPFLAPSGVGSNHTSNGTSCPVDDVIYDTSSGGNYSVVGGHNNIVYGGNCFVRCGSNNICTAEVATVLQPWLETCLRVFGAWKEEAK